MHFASNKKQNENVRGNITGFKELTHNFAKPKLVDVFFIICKIVRFNRLDYLNVTHFHSNTSSYNPVLLVFNGGRQHECLSSY